MAEDSLESKSTTIGGISYSHGGFYGAALSLRRFMENLNGELFDEFRLFMNQLEIEGKCNIIRGPEEFTSENLNDD